MSPDLNPIEHLLGILKRKVEERKVSNIHQLRDVEWKRTPVAKKNSRNKALKYFTLCVMNLYNMSFTF